MRPLFFIPVLLLALSACSSAGTSVAEQNRNPLTASRYGDELADSMANLIIMEDPAAKDPDVRKIIESEIARGKSIAEDARDIQSKGWLGGLIGIKGQVSGYVLYLPDELYLSSDFMTTPGSSLRAYLTTTIDPRDAVFPDPTALDIGSLQASYGAQAYRVPAQQEPGKFRTFVIYDTRLKMIYGFAQLSRRG